MPGEMALEVPVRPIGWARSAPKKQTLPKTGADLARYPHCLAIRTYNSIGNLTYDGRQDFDLYPIIIKRPGFFVTRCAKS